MPMVVSGAAPAARDVAMKVAAESAGLFSQYQSLHVFVEDVCHAYRVSALPPLRFAVYLALERQSAVRGESGDHIVSAYADSWAASAKLTP